MTKFRVVYTFQGKTLTTEPYDSSDLAELHRRDIAGYEGITNAYIEPVDPEEATRFDREDVV